MFQGKVYNVDGGYVDSLKERALSRSYPAFLPDGDEGSAVCFQTNATSDISDHRIQVEKLKGLQQAIVDLVFTVIFVSWLIAAKEDLDMLSRYQAGMTTYVCMHVSFIILQLIYNTAMYKKMRRHIYHLWQLISNCFIVVDLIFTLVGILIMNSQTFYHVEKFESGKSLIKTLVAFTLIRYVVQVLAYLAIVLFIKNKVTEMSTEEQVKYRAIFERVPGVNLVIDDLMGRSQQDTSVEGSCAICTIKMQTNQRVCEVNCHESHVFHEICLRSWLQRCSDKPVCPYCHDYLNVQRDKRG